jgi:cbb3-type cytochrome oxidase cytochrome c subunit
MNRSKIIALNGAAALLIIMLLIFAGTVSQGKELFLREGCSGCHNFKGHGGELAPDLTAVGDRRSTLWIMTQIKDPKCHNPDSRMPEFRHLSIIERFAIARYLRD